MGGQDFLNHLGKLVVGINMPIFGGGGVKHNFTNFMGKSTKYDLIQASFFMKMKDIEGH